MLLLLLAYLGGVLTILSPCILPVLPFVFARADRPFLRNGLPMLIGMALTFALVATLASVAGGWAVAAATMHTATAAATETSFNRRSRTADEPASGSVGQSRPLRFRITPGWPLK